MKRNEVEKIVTMIAIAFYPGIHYNVSENKN